MGLSIDIQHYSIECRYAECRDYLNVVLSVIMLIVIILSVVAPFLVLLKSDFDVQQIVTGWFVF
jgi:hypothetical protein